MRWTYTVPNEAVPMMAELWYTTTEPAWDDHTTVSTMSKIEYVGQNMMSVTLLDVVKYIYTTNKDLFDYVDVSTYVRYGSMTIINIEIQSYKANMFGYLKAMTRNINQSDIDVAYKFIDNLSTRFKKYAPLVLETRNKREVRNKHEERIWYSSINLYSFKWPRLHIYYPNDTDNTISVSHSLFLSWVKYEEACIYMENYRIMLDKIKEVEWKTIESIPNNFFNYE